MAIARDWGLKLGPALPGATQGLVLAAVLANGAPAVLKLEKPGQGVAAQAAALAAWDGAGAVRLLRADPERGALLLERLLPGTALASLCADGRDDAATVAIADLIARLRRPIPPGAVLADAQGLRRAIAACTDPRLDPPLRERALHLWRDLVASARPPVLLHGDLHHGNVLADGEGWRAVDPVGATGEPAIEAATMLTTPPRWLAGRRDLRELLSRRIAILAERLGEDRARLAAWGFAVAVLKMVWAIEDGDDPAQWRGAAATLASLLR